MNSLIEIINNIAIRWSDGMWLIVWQSAALAAIIYLVTLCIRRASAAACFWLWMLVPFRLLVMPLVTLSLPLLPAAIPGQESTDIGPLSVEVTTMNTAGALLPENKLGVENSGSMVSPMSETRPIKKHALPSAWSLLMIGWLVGLALCSTRLFRNWRRVMRIASEAVEATESGILDAAKRAGTTLGLKHMPKVLVTKKNVSPFLFGVLKPVLVIPEGLIVNVGTDGITAVLAHEFAHLRRRDPLIGWLLAICEVVYFFNPIFYFVKRRILFERERACDSWVVTYSKAKSSVYANALIRAADICRGFRTNIGPVGAVTESFGDLKKRLIAISWNLKPKARLSISALVLLVILGVVCTPGILLTARAETKPNAEAIENSPTTPGSTTAEDKAAATAALFRALPDNRTVRPDTVEHMRLAIAQGADLEAKNSKGYTPLHAAVRAYGNNYKAIRLLFEAGANPNARNRTGQIPLHHLVGGWDLSRVKLLVSAGSDVNARDKKGTTPAMIAFELGKTDMFDLMVAHGATISADLMSAYKGDLARVQSLIENDKTQETFEQGLTLLHAAAAAGHTEIAEVLLRNGLDVRSQTQEGYTALHHAAAGNHREVAELLLTKGADINGPPGKQTPLHWAIREYQKDMINWLLVKGANPNADGGRATPLQWAVWCWDAGDIAALLVSHGGNIHLKAQNYPWTPLHEAVSGGNRAMVDALIAKAGDTIAAKWAPLHAAVASGDLQAVEDLLAKGADVNAKGEGGNAKGEGGLSALHVAAGKGHKDITELLITRGADVNEKAKFDDWKHGGWTPLYFAIWQGHSDVAERLLAKGADVNVKDERNLMPLHLAIYSGPKDLAELLIVRGADINEKGTWGQTPLHIAAGKGYTDIVRMLLDRGADPNAKENERSGTPLHSAANGGHKAIAELLISKGVDVNAKNRDGKTPMSLAKEKGHTEFVTVLREHGAKE
jgi:ankyrin repeat protein/beta-lactamase regulating signal transducer with metallopeptidase domain